MSDAPDIHALARQVAMHEERMKTLEASLATTLERFKVWLVMLVFGAVVSGITLGIALSG